MQKVEGIRTVDLKIKASGYGVVNWNGTMPVRGPDNREINNHMLPKLRGYTNKTGKVKEDSGYEYKKSAMDVDFSKNPMYISQNCIRHHLFRSQSEDLHYISKKDSEKSPKKLLLSISGLLRGYALPNNSQLKRKSCLLIEDFIEQLGNGNFEQFGNSGEKDSNSIYSKTTFGDTEYLGFASINIEDLQFISLDRKNDRAALEVKNMEEAEEVAKSITKLVDDLKQFTEKSDLKPEAKAGEYSRIGSIFNETEFGILLNQDAISILVDIAINIIEELTINQAKGWMSVYSVEPDYNASNKMMRIKGSSESVSSEPGPQYAVYYKEVE